jgi:hypothetical protein
VEAQIVLREVTPPASDFLDLPLPPHLHCHASPDSITIGLCAESSNQERIVSLWAFVVEQCERIILIIHDNVHSTIIIEIAECNAAARAHQVKPWPRRAGNIFESPVS